MMDIKDVKEWVCSELYEKMPVSVAVIDSGFRIVEANNAFVQNFGERRGRFCHEAIKGSRLHCEECEAGKTFVDGKVRINKVDGIDRFGNKTSYLVHLFPLVDDDGNIPYIIEMAADTTLIDELQERYELLFDKTPCYICIIDRQFQILQANQKFRDTFGEPAGRYCHQVYKQSPRICEECPAIRVFQTGREHSTQQRGFDINGNVTHYVVTAAPLIKGRDGSVETVMEIAFDVSRVVELEEQIKELFDIQEFVIASSMDALIVTDAKDRLIIFNKSAGNLFGHSADDVIGRRGFFDEILPAEFTRLLDDNGGPKQIGETHIINDSGERIPVRISGSRLSSEDKYLGRAAFVQDLRKIKQLEEEKLSAERLAAVGQTVSGLAHGIKNIITGLEGGLYVMKTGLRKSDVDTIGKGLTMLDSNVQRISHFVKEFLSFARGKIPEVAPADPVEIAAEVYELYRHAAQQEGIEIETDFQEVAREAPMDREAIHACLSNLVSNAIDACQMSDKTSKVITIKAFEEDNSIVYEVSDNGIGMDYDVKKKVFTSFFSTKGSHQGTGLGLLLTKKTVQEHGGNVKLDSEPGEGATFRLEFPRNRLPEPNAGE